MRKVLSLPPMTAHGSMPGESAHNAQVKHCTSGKALIRTQEGRLGRQTQELEKHHPSQFLRTTSGVQTLAPAPTSWQGLQTGLDSEKARSPKSEHTELGDQKGPLRTGAEPGSGLRTCAQGCTGLTVCTCPSPTKGSPTWELANAGESPAMWKSQARGS